MIFHVQPPMEAFVMLESVVSDMEREDDEVVVLYLLSSILNRTTDQETLPADVSFLQVLVYLI